MGSLPLLRDDLLDSFDFLLEDLDEGVSLPSLADDLFNWLPEDQDWLEAVANGDHTLRSTSPNHNSLAPLQPIAASCMICRPLWRPFAEKIFNALSSFINSSAGGILAQVWVPTKNGNQDISYCRDKRHLLDEMPAGSFEISKASTLYVEGKGPLLPGLPGSVVYSNIGALTLNEDYFNQDKNLSVRHADHHRVYGSIFLSIYDSHDMSSHAVVEVVKVKEESNFDSETEGLCKALKDVKLTTTAVSPLYSQYLSKDQRAALDDISDVLRVVCLAHRLPLALTWIPWIYTMGDGDEFTPVRIGVDATSPKEKCFLRVEDKAYYLNDRKMQGFVNECLKHRLEEGQGLAGKAFQSNLPVFFHDVKEYDRSKYPLVHHANEFGLSAAAAIRLRSTYTGNNDYILEFFLPVDMKEESEQQLLLYNLRGTMQRICRNLRIVSKVGLQMEAVPDSLAMARPRRSCQTTSSDGDLNSFDGMHSNLSQPRGDDMEADGLREQCMGTRDNDVQDEQKSHCRVEFQHGNDEGKKVIPEVGMEFETEEAAYNFYSAYADIVGFTDKKNKIRRSKSHKRDGRIMDRIFCCPREGYREKDKRDVNVKVPRPETRCGCEAMMKIKLEQTGKYRVDEFKPKHNHDTSSSCKTSVLGSHRNLTHAQGAEADMTPILGISRKATLELKERCFKKLRGLFTQLEERGESEEPLKFVESGIDDLIKKVDARKGIEGPTHVYESVPKKPRIKPLPPPSGDSMYQVDASKGMEGPIHVHESVPKKTRIKPLPLPSGDSKYQVQQPPRGCEGVGLNSSQFTCATGAEDVEMQDGE